MKYLLALAFLFTGLAEAQPWPNKPVRVIVNVAAGGVADVTMRVLGARMTETLGQPFLVENRAGGDGYIGFDAVARSDADGHTLLYSPGSSMMIAPHIVNRADLDPLKALVPIAATGRVSLYVITHPERPFKTLSELLSHARANPGKLNYGTPGNGTSPHIAVEVFNREARVKLSHVPYKGAGPALNDLLGGHIDAMFDAMPVMVTQAKAGKVTPLAVTSAKRSTALPDVPTLMEAGVPDYEIAGWFGILAPPNTPPAIARRLRDEVAKAVAQPDVVSQLDGQGMLPLATQPEEWRAYMKAELDRYAKIIKDANIKPE